MTEKVSVPIGAIVALIGGILAFVGIFMEMLTLEFDIFYQLKASDSGIELLSDEGITFGRYIPLIVAILGVLLAIFCIVQIIMTSKKKTISDFSTITAAAAGIMLIFVVVFLILVSTKDIIDWSSFEAGEWTDEVKDLAQLNAGSGCWMMLAGSIVALIGGIVGFYEGKDEVSFAPVNPVPPANPVAPETPVLQEMPVESEDKEKKG